MRQILLFAALAAVLALLLVSCGGTKDKPVPTEEDAPGKAAYHKISAEEAYEMMISQEIVVVDVRTREEYGWRAVLKTRPCAQREHRERNARDAAR